MFSKKEIAEELRDRTDDSVLDFIILNALERDQAMSTGDLTKCVFRKTKAQVSAGVLYNHVYYLVRKRLIHVHRAGNGKVYKITRKGKEKLVVANKNRNVTHWIVDQMFEG